MYWKNLYPLDNSIGFPNTHPLGNDLSGGQGNVWGLERVSCTMTLNYSLFCKSSVSFLIFLSIPFDVLLGVAEQESAAGARCTGGGVRVRVWWGLHLRQAEPESKDGSVGV